MSAKKKLFNNLKDYTKGVMKSQDFVDYMKVVVENYLGSHKKARTETLSLANEAKTLREAYAVLNATILTMEDSMVGCFNEFTSGITKEHFDTIMATIGKYLSLPEVLLFMYQNLKDFDDNAATLDKPCPFGKMGSDTTSKEFFNSPTYEYIMYLLKKIAYVSAKKVYGYIENHDVDSVEITDWKNECKKYMTSWDNNLTKPDKWFNTDGLSDTDVLLGSVKIFMTAKMISLLED